MSRMGVEWAVLAVDEVSGSHFKAMRDLSYTEHPAALDLDILGLPHLQLSQLCLQD